MQLEIVAVIESLNRLRESPDYELCQLSEQKPGVLEELAAERAALLAQESAVLEAQASRLAEEIKELSEAEGTGMAQAGQGFSPGYRRSVPRAMGSDVLPPLDAVAEFFTPVARDVAFNSAPH